MQNGILDIEFILSIAVFLGVITFVSFAIISNVPVFHREALSENLRGRAYQVSHLLLFDRGEPVAWTPANAERLGLSTGEPYRISSTKISNLAAMCASDYRRVKSLLGQDFRNDVKVEINNAAGLSLLSCGPPINVTLIPEFPLVRFAVLENDQIVRISVTIL